MIILKIVTQEGISNGVVCRETSTYLFNILIKQNMYYTTDRSIVSRFVESTNKINNTIIKGFTNENKNKSKRTKRGK